MGIDAQGFIVFSEIEGTELSFVMEHVEVLIKLIVMDEFCAYFCLIVGEGAEILVLALVDVIGIVWAKFLLVGLVLVELLDPRVRVSALITTWTLLTLADIRAQVVRVEIAIPLPVLAVMVVNTVLVLMLLGVTAGMELEVVDV